jgi:uncharacterized protein YqjF (DUF2071 family)
MAQVWHDLLFAHWPFDPAVVRALIPASLRLDTFDGTAWIGVVPFRMRGVRPRLLPPLPGLSAFPELNVRTYVSRGGKPGVWFFSLDAASRLAVAGARALFHLPYYRARMSVAADGDAIVYDSTRVHPGAAPAELRGRYAPTGDVEPAASGSLDDWLTARYCLYSVDARGGLHRCEIDHAPWPLQPAQASFARNTMLGPLGLDLPPVAPLLHFARRLDVRVWPLSQVGDASP